jgi:hypothetical protein
MLTPRLPAVTLTRKAITFPVFLDCLGSESDHFPSLPGLLGSESDHFPSFPGLPLALETVSTYLLSASLHRIGITGVESCHYRNAQIQRNHISCAMLAWLRLKDLAYTTGQTVYQLKPGLLSIYLI